MAELDSIKKEKAQDLVKEGVPTKYLAEILNYDPEKNLVQDYKRGQKVFKK